jgi:hypothetical protein
MHAGARSMVKVEPAASATAAAAAALLHIIRGLARGSVVAAAG